ncbi:MAG: tetratricopeptide repeat protein, partial [Bacteroidetes bacterium]|nr:tetratricopeptide repeat protein [Bacteroidota bacterium]
MKKLLFVPLAFAFFYGHSQQLQEPLNSVEVYNKYKSLFADKKYEESLKELEKVNRNDTNYVDIFLERIIVHLQLEQYEEAIKYCQEGIALNSNYTNTFYQNLGASFNRADRYEEAIEVLDAGIKIFPQNHALHFNKAIAYKNSGKHAEAIDFLKKTIKLNPYFAQAHLQLGIYAAEEGKVAQAMLCFNMFLTLDPSGKSSLSVLQRLNEIVSSKYEREPKNINLSPEGGDDFSEIDMIITNYAALSKKYKIPVKLDLALVKQNHALFSNLKYQKNDKGFWMQTYVPFFQSLYKEGHFNEYTFYTLRPSENKTHQAMVKKNESAVGKFIPWATENVNKIHSIRNVEMNGAKQDMLFLYDNSAHTISLIGKANAEKTKLIGYVETYYTNGTISSKGNYVDGEKDGLFIYYYKNGQKSRESNFKKGEVHGEFTLYYEDGKKRRTGFYENGKQQGIQKDYNKAGHLTNIANYKDDESDGKFLIYFDMGEAYKKYEGYYLKGKLNDSLYEYYDNGAIDAIEIYKNGQLNGERKEFHRNGQLKSVVKYIEGVREGEYKSYFDNGQLYKQGHYKAGTDIGQWTSWYKDGKLDDETQYDEKGKKNGVFKDYDKDGKIIYELKYAKGEIVEYRCYDKQGKILKDSRKTKGEFEYLGIYPDGSKRAEGIYTTDGKKGLWKYYDKYGNLSSEQLFNSKGEYDGEFKNYFVSGKLKDKIPYKADKKEGHGVSYHLNGNVSVEGWYKNGLKEGFWNE